jgi:molecular chaperone GrpE
MTGGSSEHRGAAAGAPGEGRGADDATTATVVPETGAPGTGETDAAAAEEAEEAVEHDLAAVLDTARRERDEYLDMLRRVQADFENYKKRMLRQQTDLLERAAEGLVGKLLPVLDAFDLARAHLEAEGSPEGKALLQAAGLLSDTLAKEGLERLDATGVEFDPTSQEAVEHVPADPDATGAGDPAPSGPVVVDVLRAGYRYKGRVIRPAMVRVQG